VQVDRDTMDMLRAMNCAGLPGLTLQQTGPQNNYNKGGNFGGNRDNRKAA
jgi:hypothetical protein